LNEIGLGEKSMANEVRRAVMDDIITIMPLLSTVAQLHGDNRKDIFRNPTLHYSESEIREFIENGKLLDSSKFSE